jgi:hypothetical protein
LEAETIGYWLGLIGVGAILSSIVSTWYSFRLEQGKFKREQGIAYLRERLDKFYSPMIFHFENMRSWAEFRKYPQGYIWSDKTMADKIGDMNNIMRSGTRFVSPTVEKLWYKWQPLAVAAVDRAYPEFNLDDLLSATEKLHKALLDDCADLLDEYRRLIGSQ